MPTIRLTEEAIPILNGYRWPGNIRQLRNLTEQISVIENERIITPEILIKYLPKDSEQTLPSVLGTNFGAASNSEKLDQDLILKIIVELKKELADTKKAVAQLLKGSGNYDARSEDNLLPSYTGEMGPKSSGITYPVAIDRNSFYDDDYQEAIEDHEEVEESLSLEAREKELIIKALAKHKGKRKHAAKEIGISERTLYRKIKEYEITK